MIFIETHKDFDFNIPIYKENYNNFSIICREKLSNNYPINVIYDNNNYLNKWSNLYGDLTYHYHVYKHLNQYDDIIGFIQYKRYFDEYILNDYKEILQKNDVILTNKINIVESSFLTNKVYDILNLINQYNDWCIPGLLDDFIKIIYEYMPEYRYIDFYNINFIIPHNIFIMKKQDYIEYCNFIFCCYELFNTKYNIYEKNNNPKYFRILSYLGERLSTIFYIKYFIDNNKHIFYNYNE